MATRDKPNLPINYEEQLAKEAAEISSRIATPASDRIRYSGNQYFITPDGMEGETLEVVITDFVSANLFYDRPFDRGNPMPPGCFAIGLEPSMLVPSPNSPNRQSETCATCPNNQFGSAITGKGKACKNTRLLAVLPSEALDNPEQESPIWTLSVPPASVKTFDSYVHTLSVKHRTIPVGMVTQISLDPASSFASPRFSAVRPLKGEELGIFMSRRAEANQRLTVEPDTSQYVSPGPSNHGAPMGRGRR